MQLVEQLFNTEGQNRILGMTLGCREPNDTLVWNRSRDDLFSVKSGDWGSIWKLQVPSKVKIFIWRTVRGVLPFRFNLRRRRVQCPEECPLCESAVENEWHLFFECQCAEAVWRASGLWNDIQSMVMEAEGFKASFFKILDLLQEGPRKCFVMMLWCLWKRKNERLWENVSKPVHFSIQAALDLLFCWQEAKRSKQFLSSMPRPQRINGAAVWSRPVAGVLKCNVDATLFDDGKFGIGFEMRMELSWRLRLFGSHENLNHGRLKLWVY